VTVLDIFTVSEIASWRGTGGVEMDVILCFALQKNYHTRTNPGACARPRAVQAGRRCCRS